MENFTGYIEKIIYKSETTGYTVMVGMMNGQEMTLVGTTPGIVPGENIEATGHGTSHPVYGKQFQIDSYRTVMPKSEDAVERYLGSGAIKGIGPAMAFRIVKEFGEDTMEIIEKEPEKLAKVKGISKKKALEIAASVAARKNMQDAVMFLQEYGISVNMAGKIYQQYQNDLYDIIRKNPYKLAQDIDGLGFRSCDEIARKVGITADSDFRIESGIEYALVSAEGNGHCYLPMEELRSDTQTLLDIYIEELRPYLLHLQMSGRVTVKDDNVYRSAVYRTELEVAAMLNQLNLRGDDSYRDEAEEKIDAITEQEGITLDPLQRQAVSFALSDGLLVITGGPGTGKTTTINTMIRVFEEEGKTILLAAPTGRAAKRMSESTGFPASTIHRLLEYQGRPEDDDNLPPEKRKGHFERNEENPLECDVLIIDEMSMVDIFLMHALLRAILPGTRLIMVGDANQLPSVGAGNVLRDIINAGVIRTIRLEHIFRQAAESDIVVNAHRINAGESVDLGKKSKDFLFIRMRRPEDIMQGIETLLLEKLPRYLHVDPLDIQVMTPQRKGILGVENLNRVLQDVMNPPAQGKPEKELSGTRFRLGDKVMQIRNDYNLVWEIRGRYGIATEKGEGVFNGDIGIIREINSFAETLTVQFDDRFVEYGFKDCDHLELAYAITIHKSQGSEYPAVIIPMYQGPQMLMNRNLLYTAVTRARGCVCLVGDPEIFNMMLKNAREAKRYSTLADRIREIADRKTTVGDVVNPFESKDEAMDFPDLPE